MGGATYRAIVEAVKSGKLQEPFSADDVKRACPSINPATPSTFLPKHCVGKKNSNDTKLFERVSKERERPVLYRCVRPFFYGL